MILCRPIFAVLFGLWAWFPLPANSQFTPTQDGAGESPLQRKIGNLNVNPVLRKELANAVAKKDFKRGEVILVDEINRDPKSLRTAGLLDVAGGIFFLDGEYLNSAIAWEKAKAIAPLDESSRFTLAMDYVKLRRSQWADLELQKLASERPNNPLYLYWLARLDYDEQKYAEAIGTLQKVIDLDTQLTRAYDLLGLCYDYLGRLNEAIANFTRAVDLNRQQATHSPWPNLDMAVSQIELNDLGAAENNLREAIAYDPRLPQAQYQLGRIFEKERKYQEAIETLNVAVALDNKYPEPHYLLGRIYQHLGKRELAQNEVQTFQQLQLGQVTQTASSYTK